MNVSPQKPLIAVTMGDPSGIGPEIILKALLNPETYRHCRPFVIGDEAPFRAIESRTGLNSGIEIVQSPPFRRTDFGPGRLFLLSSSQGSPLSKTGFRFGVPLAENGKAAGLAIETGANLALKGEIEALTTAPINKETLRMAGYVYPGHTEFLAALSGASDFGMMLAGGPFKVAFVTIHEAVSLVPGLVKKEKVLKTILLVCREMKRLFGISEPRIAVAALNPHGGENGLFGDEEIREIIPAVTAAREAGNHVIGPISPDTLFFKSYRGEFDAVVVMYHDQGLIPLKMIAFKKSVNLTLGLPFIRTSVDHGTAYDIAGQGIADPGSLREALFLAASMAGKRRNSSS